MKQRPTARKPGEHVREIGVILVLDTSHRHDCPKVVRGTHETAAQFADRVRAELLSLQGDL